MRLIVQVSIFFVCLPSLHEGPSQVSGHRQRPFTLSQRALSEQRHSREHSGPKRSSSQAEKKKKGTVKEMRKFKERKDLTQDTLSDLFLISILDLSESC